MHIRRVLVSAGATAALAAGALAGAPVVSASPAMASASPAAVPAAASINCYDYRVYHTVGRVTCSGTGLFRAKGDCAWEADPYSGWVRINNSSATAYVECTFKIRGVSAETRPGA